MERPVSLESAKDVLSTLIAESVTLLSPANETVDELSAVMGFNKLAMVGFTMLHATGMDLFYQVSK